MKKYLRKLFKTSNIELTEVQEKVSKLSLKKNVLILSSCGSGKTEASFYIAEQWGGRYMYVLPQKTLATSIYNRLQGYNKILRNAPFTINHSSFQEDLFLENDKVVTTIDQVLSGYLGIGMQAFKKGRNVVRSNFIFDEIQLFDPERTLKTTIQMLDALKGRENKFVIMTATMPEYLIDFLCKRYDMEVIITDKPSVENRHVTISYQHNIDYKAINSFDNKQIVICNTLKELVEVYHHIEDKSRCIILNSKLLSDDRKKAEDETIMYFGKGTSENNKILISTQVIEAGMDISTTKMYCSICSIDSLVQRDGRVARWGGNGEIICFLGAYKGVYDKDVVMNTIKKIAFNNGIEFTWKIQKEWLNEILNPYYNQYISNREINKQKARLADGNKNELIRNINNVTLIIDKNPSTSSYQRQNVSISLSDLNNLSKCNGLYRYEHNILENVSFNKVEPGDTIIIKGIDCLYDKAGFRVEAGSVCDAFPISNQNKARRIFHDYKEEAWILHSFKVKELMFQKIIEEKFSSYVIDNAKDIASNAGLHDLGKLDYIWQEKRACSTIVPLAHFPFKKTQVIMEDRNHAVISAQLLRPYTDKIQMNMILQHHRRCMTDNNDIHLSEYNLDFRFKSCIYAYGYMNPLIEIDSNKDFSYKHDVLTPIDKEWVDFLYLVGTLMDCDIKAIETVQNLL